MYYIEKTFDNLHVAHRVFNQQLFSCMRDNCNRDEMCRKIHGHSALFRIGLTSDVLINDMVLDYNNIGLIKKALDMHYDHRFTICDTDPLFEFLVLRAYEELTGENGVRFDLVNELYGGPDYNVVTVHISDEVRLKHAGNPLIELLDSFTITNFNTTSENLAKWMYKVVEHSLKEMAEKTEDERLREILKNVRVAKVTYQESNKSVATYSE